MEDTYHHKILIVDPDSDTAQSFDDMLKKENVEHVFSKSSKQALKILKTTKPRFSIIIAEQNLDETSGSKFLEHAKKISPFSSLFLMADHADTQAIVNAVNLDIIQRYIAKPLDETHLISTIKSGIKSYEFLLENKKLLHLAKKQNTKLYELGCELMEATKTHNKTIQVLDEEIIQIEKNIQNLSDRPEITPDILTGKIKDFIQTDDSIDQERFNSLFSEIIRELYGQFSDMAYRNGFEISLLEEAPGSQLKEETKEIGTDER